MSEDKVVRFQKPELMRDALTELLREGAQRLLREAVQSELEEFLGEHAEKRDAQGRAAVVRNGHLPEREVLTGIGQLAVRVPKIRSRTDEPVIFRSSLVPPYVRPRAWRRRCRGCICGGYPRARWPRRSRCWWARTRRVCRRRWSVA